MKPARRKKAKPKRKKASAAPRRRYTLSQVTEFLMLDQLPSDADDSDADIDEEDRDELNQLNSTAGSSSASRSASALPPNDILLASAAEDAAVGVCGEIQDHDASDSDNDGESESLWGDTLEHFEKLQSICSNIPVVDTSLKSTDGPLQYFEAVFDRDLCDLIVAQTHLYRSQKLASKGRPMVSNEQSLTTEELKAWIGLLILMGIHQMPELSHYWSRVEQRRICFCHKGHKGCCVCHKMDGQQRGHFAFNQLQSKRCFRSESACQRWEPKCGIMSIGHC